MTERKNVKTQLKVAEIEEIIAQQPDELEPFFKVKRGINGDIFVAIDDMAGYHQAVKDMYNVLHTLIEFEGRKYEMGSITEETLIMLCKNVTNKADMDIITEEIKQRFKSSKPKDVTDMIQDIHKRSEKRDIAVQKNGVTGKAMSDHDELVKRIQALEPPEGYVKVPIPDELRNKPKSPLKCPLGRPTQDNIQDIPDDELIRYYGNMCVEQGEVSAVHSGYKLPMSIQAIYDLVRDEIVKRMGERRRGWKHASQKEYDLCDMELSKCERCIKGNQHIKLYKCTLNKRIRVCEYPSYIKNITNKNTLDFITYMFFKRFRHNSSPALLESIRKENETEPIYKGLQEVSFRIVGFAIDENCIDDDDDKEEFKKEIIDFFAGWRNADIEYPLTLPQVKKMWQEFRDTTMG